MSAPETVADLLRDHKPEAVRAACYALACDVFCKDDAAVAAAMAAITTAQTCNHVSCLLATIALILRATRHTEPASTAWTHNPHLVH